MLKPRANGHDILAKNSQHCWELLRPFARNLKFEQFQTLRSNSQQHATTCNRVSKRTKYVPSDKTRLLVFFLSLPSVCISDETLPLVFDSLLLGVWISDSTLLPVFDILPLYVKIWDKTLLLVFKISLQKKNWKPYKLILAWAVAFCSCLSFCDRFVFFSTSKKTSIVSSWAFGEITRLSLVLGRH